MVNQNKFIILFIIAIISTFIIIGTIKTEFALDLNSGREKITKVLLGTFIISERTIDTQFYLFVKKYHPVLPKPNWKIYSSRTFILTIERYSKVGIINSKLYLIGFLMTNMHIEAKEEKEIIDNVLKYMKTADHQAIHKIALSLKKGIKKMR